MGYRFTTRARDDLRDIGAYTRDRWGEAQADLYLSALERRCQEMADAPRLRRVYEDAPSYFRSLVGRHAIFYRPDGDTAILIVRMDQCFLNCISHVRLTMTTKMTRKSS